MSDDPYTIPGTNGVLRNRLDITNAEILKRTEADLAEVRASLIGKEGPRGPFDFERLRETHRYLFQDIYDWAGQPRSGMGGFAKRAYAGGGPTITFTPEDRIGPEAKRIFDALRRDEGLKGLDRASFAERASVLFVDINNLHPFREGNGRAQVQFIKALAEEAGHPLNFDVVTRERMIAGSIEGAKGDPSMMRRMFEEISDPVRCYHLGTQIRMLQAIDRNEFDYNDRYIATVTVGENYRGVFAAHRGEHFLLGAGERLYVGYTADLARVPEPGQRIAFTATERGYRAARRKAREHGIAVEAARPAPAPLVPASTLDPDLSPGEISKRAEGDPHLAPYKAAVAAAVAAAYREPDAIASTLVRQAIDTPEAETALGAQLHGQPELLGDLKGGTTLLGRENTERQAARSAAAAAAMAVSDLAAAARSIKAEIQAEWADTVRRAQIAIPTPSEDLQAVLRQGEWSATSIAEVARDTALVSEINAFLDAAGQRFGPAGMAALQGGRLTELRERMSSIQEHDVERIARLIADVAKLHERVETHHEKHQRVREPSQTLDMRSDQD